MVSWWKRSTNYVKSHSGFLFITGGIVGGAYLLSQYAISKFQQIQENLSQDKNAKENLRRRFAQNQEDCTFTVLALLPTLGDQLFTKLNVEQITESLRTQSSSLKKADQTPQAEPNVPSPQPDQSTSENPLPVDSQLQHPQSQNQEQGKETQNCPSDIATNELEKDTPALPDANGSSSEGTTENQTTHENPKSEASALNSLPSTPSLNPFAKSFVPRGVTVAGPSDQETEPTTVLQSDSALTPASELTLSSTQQQQNVASTDHPKVSQPKIDPQAMNESLTDDQPHETHVNGEQTEATTSSELANNKAQESKQKMIAERQNKLRMWNQLKVVAFSRTITSLYCLVLLTLQTHIQLNLIGRFAYLASIEAQTKTSDSAALESDAKVDGSEELGLDHDTERLYLTFSWWFLHKGWDQLSDRITASIERTFSSLSVKAPVSMAELMDLLNDARNTIEHEPVSLSSAGPSNETSPSTPLQRTNFLDTLFPSTIEEEAEMLIKAGAATPLEAVDLVSNNLRLRALLDETKDIIESEDFTLILKLCLDRMFEVFYNTLHPTFGIELPPLHNNNDIISDPLASRFQEITQEMQKGNKIRLATLFPLVARQSQLAIHGVPNEYMETLAETKQLRAFSAILYSCWSHE